MKEIIIDYRFRGPPRSGNGGYVCGMLAKTLDGVVEVTLLKPVPLNVSLKITRSDDSGATLAHGEITLASAKQTNLRLDGLAAASFAQAYHASQATPFVEDNRDASGCFVCGPGRREDDGRPAETEKKLPHLEALPSPPSRVITRLRLGVLPTSA